MAGSLRQRPTRGTYTEYLRKRKGKMNSSPPALHLFPPGQIISGRLTGLVALVYCFLSGCQRVQPWRRSAPAPRRRSQWTASDPRPLNRRTCSAPQPPAPMPSLIVHPPPFIQRACFNHFLLHRSLTRHDQGQSSPSTVPLRLDGHDSIASLAIRPKYTPSRRERSAHRGGKTPTT